jgi:outer membrane lipoprotein LolB
MRRAVVVCALLVGGCVTAPTLTPAEWSRAKVERQALDHWEMKGRAAVATATDGWTANVAWRQQAANSDLRLNGTFGVGGVRVRSDGQSFDIETSKGEKITADDAAAALEQAIGVPLPVDSLRFWLLGVPAPESDALEELDDKGRLSRLEQDGWQALYDRYVYQHDAWLPGRVRLEKGPLRLRVVVDEWRF